MQQDKLLTQKIVQDALDILRGAVTIVYPMGLPPHDVIRQEFENTEDLTGTQASLEVKLSIIFGSSFSFFPFFVCIN